MVKKILQIFSFLGPLLGLLILFYLPFIFYLVIFSFFLIIWGVISFFYISEAKKYSKIFLIFSYLGGALSLLFILLALWGFIAIGISLIMRNFLILSLVLGLFMLGWSLIGLKCLILDNKLKKGHAEKKT